MSIKFDNTKHFELVPVAEHFERAHLKTLTEKMSFSDQEIERLLQSQFYLLRYQRGYSYLYLPLKNQHSPFSLIRLRCDSNGHFHPIENWMEDTLITGTDWVIETAITSLALHPIHIAFAELIAHRDLLWSISADEIYNRYAHAEEIGQRLHHARITNGWSKTELAEKVGCSVSTITNLEKGPLKPSKWLEKTALTLGNTVEHFTRD